MKAVNPSTEIVQELETLEAYCYHEATTGSVYIKFCNPSIGSLRIADHSGRKKYKYRWNLRSDISKPFSKTTKLGVRRFYYPFEMQRELIQHILNYAKVCNNTTDERINSRVNI